MSLNYMNPQEEASVQEDLEYELLRRAVEQGLARRDQLVVRDILPKVDFGFSTEEWTINVSAGAYNACVSNISIGSDKLVGFYGAIIGGANPKTIALKFAKGTGGMKITTIWHTQLLHDSKYPAGITKEPIIYDKNDVLHISAYGKISGTDQLILLGKVVEKAGANIVG